MRFLSENDNRTEQIDKGLTNRWRWAWLNEKDSRGREWRDWRVKVDVTGCYCFCIICNKTIKYGNSGGKKEFPVAQ